ncbi:mediator of RNA polymerase II transcription subunit 26 isoform X2 [Myripristis murdjan]|uniref:Mediator of RNA polymerase II transcription subunit 26 n=1 Tax=Myripristis murdjan TaxID=586833 RepID=A0A667XXM0_9TELE|nr:mediator of RNA polymerase II transcription subunit 26 isoform X2 [Myripristis murdjan]
MTAAAATPQLLRDRLLQAVDGQSNICNMVAVMEVITLLEKYPITKEALEETRLGKLINDVRKKTKNEDLAKRAKKLLRNWQKLIEPGQNELLSKGHMGTSGSSNGGAHPCRADLSAPAATTPSGKTVPELKNRNDFNNCYSPRVETTGNRKRKGEQKGQHLPAKISKMTAYDKTQNTTRPPTNGISGGPDVYTDVMDSRVHQPSDKEISEHLDNDRVNKIPVNAVKPHPSSPGYSKPPSTSSLLKTSVLQQHARLEQASSGGQYQPRSPRCSSHSPRTPKAPKGSSLSSPARSPRSLDGSGLGASPLPSPQPLNVCVQGLHTAGSWSADLDSQSSWLSKPPSTSLHNSNASSFAEGVSLDEDGAVSNTGKKKRQKYRPKDYMVKLDGQTVEDSTKPVRLKDRRLTFDPVTGQIKPSFHKESGQEVEVRLGHGPDLQRTELLKQNPPVPPCPFQQTNWKELSRNEIIQSYLSQQSSVLTSSGAHTSGAHFFMNEYLKQEDHRLKEARKTHVLASSVPATDLPGVCREVTKDDLDRLHTKHWPGVNGCYDTKDNWYDWTECISLDPHGDESKLNILPYVCLD